MKQGKYQIIELFLYIVIVVIGVIMLFWGGKKEAAPASDPAPATSQVSSMPAEGSEP